MSMNNSPSPKSSPALSPHMHMAQLDHTPRVFSAANPQIHDYQQQFAADFDHGLPAPKYPYVAPNMYQPVQPYSAPDFIGLAPAISTFPGDPFPTPTSEMARTGSQSPARYPNQLILPDSSDSRRQSVQSLNSGCSNDGDKERQRCPHADCGKVYKDLKAHMLTHQTERPEKCPIPTCEYHTKGFARKYDKNRHTLTHYRGILVCGFCDGVGTPAAKHFNRADVFKRHLTAVHGVEQTPPNSRKKSSNASGDSDSSRATSPGSACSTCPRYFTDAQEFYEHLDDCVLNSVQKGNPAEVINAKRLQEVENDQEVQDTLQRNNVPSTTDMVMNVPGHEQDDFNGADPNLSWEELKASGIKTSAPLVNKKGNPANGVQKSRGLTHSRGGVSVSNNNHNKGRRPKTEFPPMWGMPTSDNDMKKRTAVVFDGQQRLNKTEMMLPVDQEVRIPMPNGGTVSDLDVQTLNRSEGFLNDRSDGFLNDSSEGFLNDSSEGFLNDSSEAYSGLGYGADLGGWDGYTVSFDADSCA